MKPEQTELYLSMVGSAGLADKGGPAGISGSVDEVYRLVRVGVTWLNQIASLLVAFISEDYTIFLSSFLFLLYVDIPILFYSFM